MPWLIALLRNSTLAGSMTTAANGSRWWLTRYSTTSPAALVSRSTTGPMPHSPARAIAPPRMPAVKLSTSISKPILVRSCTYPSMYLRISAVSGPMIMAPRNIGTSVPTMTPIVATAATTAPRWPCTIRPPV